MPIEDDRQKIMSLWYNIESKIKGDLANVWEERKELGELTAKLNLKNRINFVGVFVNQDINKVKQIIKTSVFYL